MDRIKGGRLRLSAALAAAGKYRYVLLSAALGAFLLLLPHGGGEDESAGTGASGDGFDRLALQEEMEEILARLDGVGRLSLMLTVEGGGEYELARDESASSRSRGGEDEEETTKTETVVLGSGSAAEVVVTQSRYPRFVGALVVCEGGGSAAVRFSVTQAVGALTGLSADRITVVRGTP